MKRKQIFGKEYSRCTKTNINITKLCLYNYCTFEWSSLFFLLPVEKPIFRGKRTSQTKQTTFIHVFYFLLFWRKKKCKEFLEYFDQSFLVRRIKNANWKVKLWRKLYLLFFFLFRKKLTFFFTLSNSSKASLNSNRCNSDIRSPIFFQPLKSTRFFAQTFIFPPPL